MRPTLKPDAQIDNEVHVLEAGPVSRRRWPMLLALILILAGAGFGVYIWMTPSLGQESSVQKVPQPRPGNLLGAAWSFETTDELTAADAWMVPDESPVPFLFSAQGAFSGERGAWASPVDDEWARLITVDSVRTPSRGGGVHLSARVKGEGLSLFVRFETSGWPVVDVPVASGEGMVEGVVPIPPGYDTVRVGVSTHGAAGVDDIEMTWTDATPSVKSRGVYEVVAMPPGLLVLHGGTPALQVFPPVGLDEAYRSYPPLVGWQPSEQTIALPGGRGTMGLTMTEGENEARITAEYQYGEVPGGQALSQVMRITGPLANQSIGVASSAGFSRFTQDFPAIHDAQRIVFGRTSDRLVLDLGGMVELEGSWQSDGSIELRAAYPVRSGGSRLLALQMSFQEERVEAAHLSQVAEDHEREGALGDALVVLERILSEFPYDEDLLQKAAVSRGRLTADMQARLDRIDEDLEDALFLASAARCREVLLDCQEAAAAFAGSDAQTRFFDRSEMVAQRAVELLAADRSRRTKRMAAIAESFASHGSYEHVAQEFEEYLTKYLVPEDISDEPLMEEQP